MCEKLLKSSTKVIYRAKKSPAREPDRRFFDQRAQFVTEVELIVERIRRECESIGSDRIAAATDAIVDEAQLKICASDGGVRRRGTLCDHVAHVFDGVIGVAEGRHLLRQP